MTRRFPRRAFLGALPAAVVAACGLHRRPSGDAATARSTTTAQRLPAPTTSPVPGGSARFVRHGPARPAIGLTFHGSGDPSLFSELLAAARRTAAPITIFAVGRWLDDNPDIARTILAAGHELANHTYTHPSLGRLGPAAVLDEIIRCRDALHRHAGTTGSWFRPSGVEIPSAAVLAAAGRAGYPTVVGYDVDPRDYQDPGAAAVKARAIAGLHRGAIVSLHTGHAGTVMAFEPIVAAARSAGLEPVTLATLLAPA